MELGKEEFGTLWNIENSWESDPVKASVGTEEDIARSERVFRKLEKMNLIEIERRDSQIYGAVVTGAGKRVLEDEKYSSWITD